ncbi:MAG: Glycosyl transferase, partial [Mesotoga prima]
QDIEFNLRLKRAGGRIILFPDIKLTYYSRSTLKELWKNNFGNGYWVIAGAKNASVPFSLRHMVPLLFVLYLVLGSILSLVSIMPKALFPGTIILYLIVVISSSLSVVRLVRNWKALFATILAFVTLHISYGMGSMAGLFSLISRREDT